jgi:hypothetical protein
MSGIDEEVLWGAEKAVLVGRASSAPASLVEI